MRLAPVADSPYTSRRGVQTGRTAIWARVGNEMAAQRPKAPTKTTQSASTRLTPDATNAPPVNRPAGGTRRQSPQLNRAQIKAMEARAAATARATAIARGEDTDTIAEVTRTATQTRTPRSRTREGLRTNDVRVRGGASSAAADFSIKTEMDYQRRDLVRLLLVAAVILVVFIVLRVVLG